jgi:hypothetical protein
MRRTPSLALVAALRSCGTTLAVRAVMSRHLWMIGVFALAACGAQESWEVGQSARETRIIRKFKQRAEHVAIARVSQPIAVERGLAYRVEADGSDYRGRGGVVVIDRDGEKRMSWEPPTGYAVAERPGLGAFADGSLVVPVQGPKGPGVIIVSPLGVEQGRYIKGDHAGIINLAPRVLPSQLVLFSSYLANKHGLMERFNWVRADGTLVKEHDWTFARAEAFDEPAVMADGGTVLHLKALQRGTAERGGVLFFMDPTGTYRNNRDLGADCQRFAGARDRVAVACGTKVKLYSDYADELGVFVGKSHITRLFARPDGTFIAIDKALKMHHIGRDGAVLGGFDLPGTPDSPLLTLDDATVALDLWSDKAGYELVVFDLTQHAVRSHFSHFLQREMLVVPGPLIAMAEHGFSVVPVIVREPAGKELFRHDLHGYVTAMTALGSGFAVVTDEGAQGGNARINLFEIEGGKR